MPNSPHSPQVCNVPTKVYNISVVGPSKSGKSCICNRFALPHPDLYNRDHLSILNASEFSSETVNCEHWLYWGCVARQLEDCVIKFRIIEQTEFLQDSTFEPFDYQNSYGDNSFCNYVHRSAATHLSSNSKLQYIGRESIIENSTYPRDYFPVGDVEIDGFIVIYDASPRLKGLNQNSVRCNAGSINVIQELLSHIIKLKKPVVLAFSKVDKYPKGCSDDLSFLQKSNEFRKVPWIETSAHANVNIEETFLTLLKIIELKPRTTKLRNLSYLEALHERYKETENARGAFDRLISISPSEFLINWSSFMGRYSHQMDVVNFINLVGSGEAQNRFEDRVEKRRKNYRERSLRRLRQLLWHILPNLDIVNGLSFDEVVSFIRNHEDFSDNFQDDCPLDKEVTIADNSILTRLPREDGRIPLSLAIRSATDGGTLSDCPLKDHLNNLAVAKSKHLEQANLETALHQYRGNGNVINLGTTDELLESGTILPGQPMSDVKPNIPLLSSPNLTEDEIVTIYKQFQIGLHVRAREDFLDLLFERTDLFVKAVRRYLGQLDDSSVSMSLTELPITTQIDYNFKGFGEASSFSTLPQTCSQPTQVQFVPTGPLHKVRWLSAPPRGAKEMQLSWLTNQLICDRRYKTMTLLPSERQTLITTYFDMLLPTTSPQWPAPVNPVVSNMTAARTLPNESKSDQMTTARKSFSIHGLWNPSGTTSTLPPSTTTDIPSPCTIPTESHGQYCPDYSYPFPLHPTDSLSLSPLACSSASWGGCMDILFRQLACQYLPASPRCFESCMHWWEDKLDPNPDWPNTYMHSDFYSNLRSPSLVSGSSNVVGPDVEQRHKASLVVGIACVCTDTQAARAAIHLLACAGFCMISFQPHNHHPNQDSMSHKLLDPCSERFNNLSSGVGSSIPSEENRPCMDPLAQSIMLSSTWPLPTARLPRFHQASMSASDSLWIRTTTSDFYKHPNMNKVYDGQVQVDLMSHHKLLNNLLDDQDHDPYNSRLMNFSLSASNTLPRSPQFGGLIFVVSAPSSEDRKYNPVPVVEASSQPPPHSEESLPSIGSLKISQSHADDSVDFVIDNIEDEVKQSLKRINSLDSEDLGSNDNVITPRPLSQEHFFDNSCLETVDAVDLAPESSLHSAEHVSSRSACCTCCEILSCPQKSHDRFDCACGYCCTCVHSLLPGSNSSSNKSHNLAEHKSGYSEKTSPTSASCMGPHRRRSWEARVAVVNSMIDQIPKDVPRLVLMAEPNLGQAKSGTMHSDWDDQLPPILYPAPDQFKIPLVFDSCRLPQCSGSVSLDSDSNSLNPDAQSPDWIPAGTNVLDHVINFLGECWDNIDQQQQQQQRQQRHHHESVSRRYRPNCTCDRSPSKPVDCSYSALRLNSEPRDVTIDTSPVADKHSSSNSGLLNSLAIASATGRKAVHTANQALRKLSQSAKRRSVCRLSSSSTSTTKESQTSGSLESHHTPTKYDNPPYGAEPVASVGVSTPALMLNVTYSMPKLSNAVTVTSTIPSNTTINARGTAGMSMFSSSSPVQSVHWGLDTSSQNELEDNHTVCNPSDEIHPSSVEFARTVFRTSVNRFGGLYDDDDDDDSAGVTRRSMIQSHKHSRCSVPDCTRLNSIDCSLTNGLDLNRSENLIENDSQPTEVFCSAGGDHLFEHQALQTCFTRTSSRQSGRWGDIGSAAAEFENTPTVSFKYPSGHLPSRVSDSDSQVLTTDSISTHETEPCQDLEISPDLTKTMVTPAAATSSSVTTAPNLVGFSSYHGGNLSPEQSYTRDELLESINYSGYYSDDLESIYEDPDQLFLPSTLDNQVKTLDVKFSQSTLCNPSMLSQPLTTGYLIPSTKEEHIYMDPTDCIGPAYVERHRFVNMRTTISRPRDHPRALKVVAKSACHDLPNGFSSESQNLHVHHDQSVANSAGHCTSAVSLSDAPNNWVVNVLGRHRERHRSFSTPEGCSTLVTESDNENPVSSAGDTSSVQAQSRSLLRPLFPNPAQFRSVRSSYARHDPELHSSSTGMTSARFPASSLDDGCSSQPVHEPITTTTHSAPVSSPASTVLSDDIGPDKPIQAGSFLSTTTRKAGQSCQDKCSSSATLSRFHHHHFWHHPNCMHYQMHQIRSYDDLMTDFKCSSQLTNEQPNNHSRMASTATTTMCSTSTTSTPDDSTSFRFPSCCHRSNLFRRNSGALDKSCSSIPLIPASSSKHISKPIFIDPTDFPTHSPRPFSFISTSSMTGNARANFSSYQTPTCLAFDNHTTNSNASMPSNSSPSSVPSSSKDSKWLKRGRKLNFLYHRFSGETQLSPSSSLSFPSNIFHPSKTPNRLSPALSCSTSKSTPPKSPSPSDGSSSSAYNSSSIPNYPTSCHSIIGRYDGTSPAQSLPSSSSSSSAITPYCHHHHSNSNDSSTTPGKATPSTTLNPERK